ncbi:MAG: UDP-N-acetylmuramoyl-tripeptide--D-alanyl-D-alanine ligase [Clostridia bacterium]|nr:UDP-N-acetylmuramoyl-tripeptide--D-alanyl-D-alanine ligase [Clostridia bacterium]
MRIKLGMPLMLSEIASMIGEEKPTLDTEITHVSTDTRELKSGDLFIPQSGGEIYLDDALKLGAVILTKRNFLLEFACGYCKTLPYILYKIGITGSVGKTTTKEMLKSILEKHFKVHANEGNFNNHIGLPMSILSAPPDTEILIMEMGMNHMGEIRILSECLRPNIAVITNVGTSHIGNLGSRENIARAKLEILIGMDSGVLFVPYDEPLLNSHPGAINVYSESTKAMDRNMSMAVSVAEFIGITKPDLSNISTENIRQKMIFKKSHRFLTDYYNSSYESVAALIESAKEQEKYPRRALVLGDILELGEYCQDIHLRVGKLVKPSDFDHLFLFGEYAEFIYRGALENSFDKDKIFINSDLTRPDITAEQIKANCDENELILMKASRGVRLERILDYFD